MPKAKDVRDDFKPEVVEIRHPNGKTEKVAPAAADLLCRKAGCVDVKKEEALKKAAEKAAEEK